MAKSFKPSVGTWLIGSSPPSTHVKSDSAAETEVKAVRRSDEAALCRCCYFMLAVEDEGKGWFDDNGDVTEKGRRELQSRAPTFDDCVREAHAEIQAANVFVPGCRRAPALPQIDQHDLEATPTTDVDGPHTKTVPNDYHGETDTQQARLEREAEQAREKFEQTENETREKAKKAKSEAKGKGKEAKDAMKKAGHELDENKDNPVVIGNFAMWAAVAGAIGFSAYRQQQTGNLDWKFAGAWAGVLGLVATGDYFLTGYLFKNKYPRK